MELALRERGELCTLEVLIGNVDCSIKGIVRKELDLLTLESGGAHLEILPHVLKWPF
jgi:hypothetical protein